MSLMIIQIGFNVLYAQTISQLPHYMFCPSTVTCSTIGIANFFTYYGGQWGRCCFGKVVCCCMTILLKLIHDQKMKSAMLIISGWLLKCHYICQPFCFIAGLSCSPENCTQCIVFCISLKFSKKKISALLKILLVLHKSRILSCKHPGNLQVGKFVAITQVWAPTKLQYWPS